MRVLPIILPLAFIICSTSLAFCQSSGEALSDRTIWEKFFATNLRYPSEALKSQESSRVVFSVKIGADATLDSVFIVEDAPAYFLDHVQEVFSRGSTLWNKSILENRPVNERYLVCFNFEYAGNNGPPADLVKSARDLLDKGKADRALKILDKLIEKQPYDYQNFELRAEAHRQLGNTEPAQRDYMNSRLIKKKVIFEFDMVAFTQVTRTTVQL